jgi:xanthine dehydrogenase accessory factor
VGMLAQGHSGIVRYGPDGERRGDDISVFVAAYAPRPGMPLAYVGAMGSRRTNDDRMGKLRALGVSDTQLVRLHAPIGLDVGARTPEETAVSIAAEIIGLRWGGSGTQLRRTHGPIHHGDTPTGPQRTPAP